jgi:hypothetical protein
MKPYEGEVVPFQEYDGEVLPLEDEVQTKQDAYVAARPNTLDPTAIPDAVIGIGKGIYNAAAEGIKTIGSLGEAASDATNRIENPVLRTALGGVSSAPPEAEGQATSALEAALPKATYEGPIQETAGPAAELGASVYGGVKTGVAVAKTIAGKTPGIVRKGVAGLGGLAAGETATVAGMDKETDPLVSGPEGSFANLPTLLEPAKPTDDPATAKMKKTAILAQDAVLTGAVAGGASQVAGIAVPYALKVFRRAFLDYNNLDAIQKNFVGTIMDRVAKVPDGATTEEVQAAYQDVIDYVNQNNEILISFGKPGVDDIVAQQDTITTLLQKLDPNDPKDMLVKQELEALRASALGGNQSPRLKGALEAPKDILDNRINQLDEASGGVKAIEQTQEALAQSGKAEMAGARVPEDIVRGELDEANQVVDKTLRDDPYFGPRLSKAEQSGVKLDVNEESRDLQTKAVEVIKDKDMASKKSVVDDYKKVADSGSEADTAGFNTLRTEVQDNLSPTNKKHLDGLLEKSDGTFGYLYTKVRPEIGKMLDGASGLEKDALLRLKQDIDGNQMDFVASGIDEYGIGTRTAQEAKDAKANFIRDKRTWDDGVSGEMRANRLDNPPYDPAHPERPSRQRDFSEKGRSTLMNAIKDPNRRESIQALRGAIGIKNSPLIDDVIVAEAAKDAIDKLAKRKGNIADLELDEIAKPLQDMGAHLSGVAKGRLEKLVTNMRDGKITAEKLRTELKTIQKVGDEAEERVYQDYLGDFVEKHSDGFIKKGDPEAVMKSLMHKEDSTNKIGNIIKAVKGDEVAQQGLEAAWARQARVLMNSSKDVNEFPEHFVKYGKQIFGDNSAVVEGFQQLNQRARTISNANKVRMGGGLPYAKNKTEATGAVNQIITFVFGVLNPTAAKIRTISGDVLRNSTAGDKARLAGDLILANGKDFAKIAQELTNAKAKVLSPQQKKMVYKWITKMGIYGDGDEMPDLGTQTNEAFDIDESRPIIENDDGSFSTERTATRQDKNGKWVVFPTIVDGKELSEDQAWDAISKGKNKSVGSFDSLEESEVWATKRSEEIGKVRQKDRVSP